VSKIRTTESTVVELSDGRIMLNSRNQNVANSDGKHLRVVSISRDEGISFPEAKSYEAEKLIEPKGVQASLLYHSYNKKTKKGNILFSNPANMENRCNGTLRLSTDDAKTWSQEYVYAPNTCENKYFTGYSDLALFPNGNVGVLYERGNDFNDPEVRYEEIGFTVVRIQPNR
jgi:sialidase-1